MTAETRLSPRSEASSAEDAPAGQGAAPGTDRPAWRHADTMREVQRVRTALMAEHQREIYRVRAEATAHRAAIVAAYESSTSWRLTAPLRALSLRGGLRALLRRRGGGAAAGAIAAPAEATAPAGAPPGPGDARAAQRALLRARLEAFLSTGTPLRLPDPGPAPAVSIVLILWNQAELTLACLESILAHAPPVATEVVILDNASTDATMELMQRIEGATILRNEENLHFLRGVNRAAQAARGRHLLLLNNDAQLLPGSLAAALATLEAEPATIGAVGARILLPDGTLQEAGSVLWRDGRPDGYARGAAPAEPAVMFRRDVDYASGAFLLTPRALFERMGGFDERYAPAYFEETDYCVRLWEAGLRVVYEPQAVILHQEFGSGGSAAAQALQERNLEIFRARHADWLAGQVERGAGGPAALLAARARPPAGPRVLMLEDRVPHERLGSGFPRAADLANAIAEAGAALTFFPMTLAFETWPEVRRTLDPRIEVMLGESAATLGDFLAARHGHYDAVLVCRPHNLARLATIAPDLAAATGGARLVYDAEAVFALREALQRAVAGRPMPEAERRRMIAAEVAPARQADLVLAVSEAERRLLQAEGLPRVVRLGHAVTPDPTEADFAERQRLLFVGSVHDDESPNADSIRWFAREILPLLRRALPAGGDLRLTVAGRCDAPSVLALGEAGALEILGPVDSLRPIFAEARVMVAPTRYAAGIPHKAHQAAAFGVPIVATPLIAEQLGWAPGRDLLAEGDPAGFAAACARLWTEAGLWRAVRQEALARVAEDCAPAAFRREVAAMLAAIPRLADTRRAGL